MTQSTVIPEPAAQHPERSLLIKFLDCMFAAFAVVDFFDVLVMQPASIFANRAAIMRPLTIINALMIAAGIVFAIIYPLRWRRREAADPTVSPIRHAWFTGIIRYWLAAVILNYGFAKLLGTQFAPAYFKADSTWASLSGYDLTWNYFSYSYAMSTIIGGIQIIGCLFLFFRRTVMPGILLLLPVMIIVSLIDIFFHIPIGATANAILFTGALTYLLTLQGPAIRAFLRAARPALPPIWLRISRNLIRLALTAWAFAFIAWFAATARPANLTGKWHVDQLTRNGRAYTPDAWLTDSLDWKNIYLEKFGRATFSPNPYIVEPARSTLGDYRDDPQLHAFIIRFFGPSGRADTISLTATGPDHMQWSFIDHADTVVLSLTRIPSGQ